MKPITQKMLKKVLRYNPTTGVFKWKEKKNGVLKSMVAGCLDTDSGYTKITIFGVQYGASRLAWLYVHGYFPENDIDHIDRNRSEDKIKNLREASRQCNNRNTGSYKHNKSGVKGVCFGELVGKWRAYIKIFGEFKSLGNYFSFDNAVCARLAGEQCLGWDSCDQNSPAYKYVQTMLAKSKSKEV